MHIYLIESTPVDGLASATLQVLSYISSELNIISVSMNSPTPTSFYVGFYSGDLKTPVDKLNIDEVLAQNPKELENRHAYIQCLFPSPKPSEFHPEAVPEVFTPEAAEEMLKNDGIMKNVNHSIDTMFAHWGLERDKDNNVTIVKQASFKNRLYKTDHNQMRMTRLFEFLKMMKQLELMENLLRLLAAKVPWNSTALKYWKKVCSSCGIELD